MLASHTCKWSVPADLLAWCRYSIHGPSDAKAEQRAAEESFPRLIQGTENCYHCGFHDGAQRQSEALSVIFALPMHGAMLVWCMHMFSDSKRLYFSRHLCHQSRHHLHQQPRWNSAECMQS